MSDFYQSMLDGFIAVADEAEIAVKSESDFFNRELSWMAFNERVLEEARDKANPLFERLNFLSITASNLDEFFMIRVASLIEVVKAGVEKADPSGMEPAKQLELLIKRNKQFFKKQYSSYNRQILPELQEEGIRILHPDELNEEQLKFVESYFERMVVPVLTPLAVDAGRPFPLIANKSLNLLVLLDSEAEKEGVGTYAPFAIVQIPRVLPRLLALPATRTDLILLEDLIKHFLQRLFDNVKIRSISCFRIMRDADFNIAEDDASDLLLEIEESLRLRQRGEVIRLEIEHAAEEEPRQILIDLLPVPPEQLFRIRGPIDLCFLSALPKLVKRSDLNYPPFRPAASPRFSDDEDVFDVIREGDVLLHHPYESFEPVIRVIQRASRDENVLAIKQTLYRVSGHSPIIAALAEAARQGKQVFVLVELKARFDEEQNIHWARELERAGCHVIYGLRGLKTHSKITLIVREEEGDIRRYVHLGTGNYNDSTAKIYTDLGLWTASSPIGRDATDFFNMISGYSIPDSWNKLIPAPSQLRRDSIFRIRREAEHARSGRNAMIIAKMNSLVDPQLIAELYAASQAGVWIRLSIRGVCCLRPGVTGLSERIEVRSLVGRFLEHSRLFYYYNDGAEDLFLGSADWMPRNLDRRIELMAPLEDEAVRERIFHILRMEFEDTDRARLVLPDGSYRRVDRRGREALDSQERLREEARRRSRKADHEPDTLDRYQPMEADEWRLSQRLEERLDVEDL